MVNKLNEDQLYYALYFQLDRFYDQNEAELKGGLFEVFVSAMDPFIFVGARSADPAMSFEFGECFKKTFGEQKLVSYDEGFEFIKIYFDYYIGIYAFDLQSIYCRLSRKDWYKCCDYAIEFLKENRK